MRTVLLILTGILFAFGGWIGGSLYPVPPEMLAQAHLGANAVVARVQSEMASVDLAKLQESMNPEHFDAFVANATRIATEAGNALTIEHLSDAETTEAEHANAMVLAPEPPAPAGAAPRA